MTSLIDVLLSGVDGAVMDSRGSTPPTVDLPASQWLSAGRMLKAAGATFFDWLTAVDRAENGLEVVMHVVDPAAAADRVLVRATLPPGGDRAAAPMIDSVVSVWAGAAWHERETYEMFGIVFAGHADLRRLLLDNGFQGTPLRKDFVLAARVATPWPGEVEPGRARGRKPKIPGVPDGWLKDTAAQENSSQ